MAPSWRELLDLVHDVESALAMPEHADIQLKAWKLADKCTGALPPGHPPQELTSVFSGLASRLAEVTAAAKREVQQGGAAAPRRAFQMEAVCWSLGAIMCLLERRLLVLPEPACMRALAAAAVPLELMLAQLQHGIDALGDCTPGNREVFADLLHSLLDSTTFALVMLMDAAQPGREGQPPVLPPRCLAVLRATQLKPAVLLRFIGTVSAAAEAWMEARDTRRLPCNFTDMLVRLFDDAGFGGELQERLQQQPYLQVQRCLIGLAAKALRGPVPPGAASQPGSRELGQPWTDSVWDAARLLSLPALEAARRQLAPTLVPTAAGLATQLVTDLLPPTALVGSNAASGCAIDQADILIATLFLAFQLCADTVLGGRGQVDAAVVHMGLLCPLLHRLAAAVTAEAPPASSSSSSGGGRAPGSSGSLSFGELCWGPLRRQWLLTLIRGLAFVAHALQDADPAHSLSTKRACLEGATAGQALLRLVPLLHQQPAASQGGALAGPGSEPAAPADLQRGAARTAPAVLLLAKQLTDLPPLAPACSDVAAASFQSFSTACRLLHALGASMPAGGTCEAVPSATTLGGFVPTAPTVKNAVDALQCALRSALQVNRRLLQQPDLPLEDAALHRRRLECMLLLYLAAVPVLLLSAQFAEFAAETEWSHCTALWHMLAHAALQDFWRQLLQADSSSCGGGSSSSQPTGAGASGGRRLQLAPACGAVAVIADTSAACLQMVRARGMSIAGSRFADDQTALAPARLALHLAPEAGALLAQHRGCRLLQELALLAAAVLAEARAPPRLAVPEDLSWTSDHSPARYPDLFVAAWRLAKKLVASLAGRHADPVAYVRQQVEQGPEFSSIADAGLLAALDTFWQLLRDPGGDPELTQDICEARPPGPPFTPEQHQQLAVRCAKALGTRTCANPRCASLAGASEAASRGRKCGGCHAVRYCSEACSKADWRQHRVACRLLQQEAGGG